MKRDEIVLELDLQGAADAVVRFRTRLDEEARKIRMMEDYAECGIGGILHNIGALRRAGIPIRAIIRVAVSVAWARLRTTFASPRSRI